LRQAAYRAPAFRSHQESSRLEHFVVKGAVDDQCARASRSIRSRDTGEFPPFRPTISRRQYCPRARHNSKRIDGQLDHPVRFKHRPLSRLFAIRPYLPGCHRSSSPRPRRVYLVSERLEVAIRSDRHARLTLSGIPSRWQVSERSWLDWGPRQQQCQCFRCLCGPLLVWPRNNSMLSSRNSCSQKILREARARQAGGEASRNDRDSLKKSPENIPGVSLSSRTLA